MTIKITTILGNQFIKLSISIATMKLWKVRTAQNRYLNCNIDLTTRKSMEKDSFAAVLQNNTENFHTPKSNTKVKSRTKRRLENVKINLLNCKYDVIKNVTTDKKYGFGWKQESQTQELTSTSK